MLAISSFDVLRLTEKLISVAIILQTIELLMLRSNFGAKGVWTWSLLSTDYHHLPRPLQFVLAFFFGDKNFVFLLLLQFVLAVLVFLFPLSPASPLLFLTALLVVVRFRGTFNGGSDYMTLVVLFSISLAAIWKQGIEAAIFYIAVQSTLSYVVAGMVKLKHQRWRSGVMLREFILNANYQVPSMVRSLVSKMTDRSLAFVSLSVILFECTFPFGLLHPSACLAFLFLGAVFHLVNFYVLGLNRFFFAWLATYPTVYFLSCWLQNRIIN